MTDDGGSPGRQDSRRGGTDRRTFVKGAALASVGLAGGLRLAPPVDARQALRPEDPERPPGLGPTAILDNRFPVAYRSSVPNGISVLMRHFEALSRRDPEMIADTLHFPFGSFEAIDPVVTESADHFRRTPPASLNVITDNPRRFTERDGHLKPGAYDVFVHLEVINCDPKSVGLAMVYDRYDENGKKLLRCEGVYAVTNNDGRWAIQLMSTIFTPAEMIGERYPDTIEAARRTRIDHNVAYQQADREVDVDFRQRGTSLGSAGGSPGAGAGTYRAAVEGDIMDAYRIRGVTNRLSVSEFTEEDAQRLYFPTEDYLDVYENYRSVFPRTGVGEWGYLIGVLPRGETRVLHHDYHKAHVSAAASRFTPAGEVLSISHDLAVVTYRKRKWGRAGTLTYTARHDRANDVQPGPGGRAPGSIT